MDGNFLFLTGGRLFFFLLAGTLLAWGLHKWMAFLGLAAGVSQRFGNPSPDPIQDAGKIGRLGWWAFMGISLSLFASTFLVASMIHFGTRREALILSLAVWAGFLFLILRVEASAPGPVAGLLAFLSASRDQTAMPSPSGRPSHAYPGTDGGTASLAARVREEFQAKRGSGRGSIREKLLALIAGMPAQEADRFEIEREAENLFRDQEIRDPARRGELQRVDRNRFRETVAGRSDITAEESGRWADALYTCWNELREGAMAQGPVSVPAAGAGSIQDAMAAGTAALVAEAGGRTAGTGKEDALITGDAGSVGADKAPGAAKVTSKVLEGADAVKGGSNVPVSAGFRERLQGFKDFLRDSDRRELNPVRLEQEVERLVTRSDEDFAEIEKGARALKKEDVVHILKQRKDISPQEADSIAELTDSARTRALSRMEMREHRRQEATDKAIARLRDRIYALKRPERDYESFRRNVERLLDDPGVLPALAADAQGLDAQSLADLFAALPGISRQDAERMAESADQAIRLAQNDARAIEAEIRRREEEARIGIQAREAVSRKLAATAAAWLSTAVAAGGAAAALGGWLATRS